MACCDECSDLGLAIGPIGPKGDTGVKGDTGNAGAAGAKGDKGDKGDTGAAGGIAVYGIVYAAGQAINAFASTAISGLTTTPAAGNYFVRAEVKFTSDNNPHGGTYGIYKNGVLTAGGTRPFNIKSFGEYGLMDIQDIVTVAGADIITIKVTPSAGIPIIIPAGGGSMYWQKNS